MTMFDKRLRCRSLRRGMTLVELLVVVSIMMVLAAYVLPKLQLNSAGRRVREAARMVNVYLGVARNRAVETGRPCGVMFKRLEGDESGGSNILFQVEVPPPYAGDVTDAVVKVQDWTVIPGGGLYNAGTASLKALVRLSDLSDGLVRYGDQIQLNRQGPWYTILNDNKDDVSADDLGGDFPVDADGFLKFSEGTGTPWVTNHWLTLVREYEPGVSSPWPKKKTMTLLDPPWSTPVPFAIRRQPSQTMAPPLVLPTGTAVDLGASGTNETPALFDTNSGIPVTVMFSPNGAVSRYYYQGGSGEVPSEPLFFLVGRQEQLGVGRVENPKEAVPPATVPDADEETMANWQIMTNLWLTMNPQNGTTSVSENAVTDDWYTNCENDSNYATDNDYAVRQQRVGDAIDEARTFAKQARNMGGR